LPLGWLESMQLSINSHTLKLWYLVYLTRTFAFHEVPFVFSKSMPFFEELSMFVEG
jgi:hypothetical protein